MSDRPRWEDLVGGYEPEPRRNPLAVAVNIALVVILIAVMVLALLGRLDWLPDLGELIRR